MPSQKKTIAVIMPTLWDDDQLARAAVQARYTLRVFGRDRFHFMSPDHSEPLDVETFVAEVCAALASELEHGQLAGVIGTHDYPGCLIAACIAERLGLEAPSVRALLSLSHKFHARQLQRSLAPEATPEFWLLDPDAPPPALPFPLFVKPIKGMLSTLAREVADAPALAAFLAELRQDRPRRRAIDVALAPMGQLLRRYPDLAVDPRLFIAERVARGQLVTLEGYVRSGVMSPLGIVDSIFYPGTRSFERFEYPSALPAPVQRRMRDVAERVLLGSGFDHGMFNVELMYDEDANRISIIEVNPRMCTQFSDLYEKVDGINGHDLQLALAAGEALPTPRAPTGVAASFVLRTFRDAWVRRLPSTTELEDVGARFPGVRVRLLCVEGQRLSQRLQDEGSFRYAAVNLGAEDKAALAARFAEVRAALRFELEPIAT